MKRLTLNIRIQEPFGNLYRKQHVLIACRNTEGKILVGKKPNFYPGKVTRLLGGGVHEGENSREAALRELQEELNIHPQPDDLNLIGQVVVNAETTDGRTFESTTYIFFLRLKDNNYKAGDDVKGIMGLTLAELDTLAETYDNLKSDHWYEGEEGRHSWGDYGKIYGPIHHLVHDEVKKMNP